MPNHTNDFMILASCAMLWENAPSGAWFRPVLPTGRTVLNCQC